MIHTTQNQDADFQNRMRQLEGLLLDIDAIPDPIARAKTTQVIQGLLDFHGQALRTLLHHLTESDPPLLDTLLRDDLVSSLLLLHNLHPLDLESRVKLALTSHHGSVELLHITPDNIIHLRLKKQGCPSSAATLQSTLEQSLLQHAPDAAGLQIESPPPHQNFVPLERLTINQGAHHHVA